MSRLPQHRIRRPALGIARTGPLPPATPVIEEIVQLRRQVEEMNRAMNANAIEAPEYASVRQRELIRAVDGPAASCNLCCCLRAGFLRRGCSMFGDVCFSVCEFCFGLGMVVLVLIFLYLVYRVILFI